MGFKLEALEASPEITLLSFLVIILFIVGFDFFTKFLEFTLEDSPRYNRMVQNIYKELMQMGVISFIFVLYESASHDSGSPWLEGLDFSHILLFFVAICFVVHTFYLIGVSIRTSNSYARLNAQNSYELVTSKSQLTKFHTFLFNMVYLPFSRFREKFEFKLLHILFRETFSRLPEDFSFNLYLSKSFEQYSLKIMDFSVFSWLIVFMLALANYIRIQIKGHIDCEHHHHECGQNITTILLVIAVMACSYVLIVMFVARVYELRLLTYVGVRHPSEYEDFLNFASKEEKRMKQQRLVNDEDSNRYTSEQLKEMVDEFVDAKENNEENQIYRQISHVYTRMMIKIMDIGYSIQVWYRVRMRKKVDPLSNNQVRRPSLLSKNDSIDEESDNGSVCSYHSVGGPKSTSGQEHGNGHTTAREKIQANLQERPRSMALSPNRKTVAENVVNVILQSTRIKKDENSKRSIFSKNSMRSVSDHRLKQVSSRIKSMVTGHGTNSNTNTNNTNTSPTHVPSTVEEETKEDLLPSSPTPLTSLQKPASQQFNQTIRRSGNVNTAPMSSTTNTATTTISQIHGSKATNNKPPMARGTSTDSVDSDSPPIPPPYIPSLFEKYIEYRDRNGLDEMTSSSYSSSVIGSILPLTYCRPKKRELKTDFNEIFFLQNPIYFFRVVEIALMVNSLLYALGIYFSLPLAHYGEANWYIIIIVPLFVTFPCIGRIIKVASMIKAVTELQLEVIRDVLTESEDMKLLADELRNKILSKLDGIQEQIIQPALNKKMQNAATALKQDIIHRLFQEIDVDGNGIVDKVEFRNLLSMLQLHYSDKRFQRLFKAVDVKAKGKLGIADIELLLFPPNDDEEQKKLQLRRQSKGAKQFIGLKLPDSPEDTITSSTDRNIKISTTTTTTGGFKPKGGGGTEYDDDLVGGGGVGSNKDPIISIRKVGNRRSQRQPTKDTDEDGSSGGSGGSISNNNNNTTNSSTTMGRIERNSNRKSDDIRHESKTS